MTPKHYFYINDAAYEENDSRGGKKKQKFSYIQQIENIFSFDQDDGQQQQNVKNSRNGSGPEKNKMESFLKKFFLQVRNSAFANWIIHNLELVPIISPSSYPKLLWDLLNSLILLTFMFNVSLHVAFEYAITKFLPNTLQIIFSILLWVDILINLNTAYYDKGILILDRFQAIKRWISREIQLEIITILPLTYCIFTQLSLENSEE